MRLTTSRPTSPGWYWIKGPFYQLPWIIFVRQGVYPDPNALIIETSLPIRDYHVSDDLFNGWLWAGPIPYPT